MSKAYAAGKGVWTNFTGVCVSFGLCSHSHLFGYWSASTSCLFRFDTSFPWEKILWLAAAESHQFSLPPCSWILDSDLPLKTDPPLTLTLFPPHKSPSLLSFLVAYLNHLWHTVILFLFLWVDRSIMGTCPGHYHSTIHSQEQYGRLHSTKPHFLTIQHASSEDTGKALSIQWSSSGTFWSDSLRNESQQHKLMSSHFFHMLLLCK